jgi:hypothetical protein
LEEIVAEFVPTSYTKAAGKMMMNAIRRNAPCPCDSGKRFKHCHGREFDPTPVPREIAESVRFVCFETHLDDFRLATIGGTAFVVRYTGTPCAITCRHVLSGFKIVDLVITDARLGRKVAGVRGIYYPGNLNGDVQGSDLDDVCVIAFHEHGGEFFDCIYDLDRLSAATSEPASRLIVTGFLKQKSSINPPYIFAGLCFLQFTDAGVAAFDRAFRRGLATYSNPDFDNISGMSGAPVYNLNSRAVCGMVARGGLQSDGVCAIYFIDIFDIMQFLDAVSNGSDKVSYVKDKSIL